jgi:hypothetical protein
VGLFFGPPARLFGRLAGRHTSFGAFGLVARVDELAPTSRMGEPGLMFGTPVPCFAARLEHDRLNIRRGHYEMPCM